MIYCTIRITASSEVVTLTSPEKLNTAASYIVGLLSELTDSITEQTVPDELLASYREPGITLV